MLLIGFIKQLVHVFSCCRLESKNVYEGTRPLLDAHNSDPGMTAEFLGEHFEPQVIERKAKYLESSAPKKKEKPKKNKRGQKKKSSGPTVTYPFSLPNGQQWPPTWLPLSSIVNLPEDMARVCICESAKGEVRDCECTGRVARMRYVPATPEFKDWDYRQETTTKFLVGTSGRLARPTKPAEPSNDQTAATV